MKRQVTIVELSVYDNTVPLVAGYLQCYATRDPHIDETFGFSIYSRSLRTSPDEMLAELLAQQSEVYAFSCYIWNMGVVRRLFEGLLSARPDARFVLGGPQVMNHAADYVPSDATHVVVCNGEGEQAFYEYLCQIADGEPDFSQVSGISYFSDAGELITTDDSPRLVKLDEVPSPFAAGLFDDGEYTFSVLETNRGCPFHCGFCFWGAATNSKVYKFETERVMGDIEWIARNGVASVFIADANWGLSPRDVDLSRYIIENRKKHGFPTSMVIAAAKNRPERVAEITDILVQGGLVTSQPISLQTVNANALELIDRKNIRESTYMELQKSLNDKGISSFIELIWPLPGETLESFKAGVGRLCRLNANTLTIYPQLLLHNTDIYERREVLGIEVARAPDDAAEADVVVATKWASRADVVEGAWFYYAVHSLYNARSAYHLASYLDRNGIASYEEFLSEATRFIQHRDDDLCRFFGGSVSTADNYDLLNVGKSAHMVLQSHRGVMDRLLLDFCRTQSWWADPAARLALDIDLLARPYIYAEDVVAPEVELSEARLVEVGKTGLTIEVPEELAAVPQELGLVPGPVHGPLLFTHPRQGKMPHPRMRSMEQNAGYCHVMIQRLRQLLPTCEPLDVAPAGAKRS
ncbi:B12-binding domain-containing radical SAM protein [Streptomyces sp. NPDC006530]|uniref:B12-binding domain-containing radical SAM protein n=1 Tax=Streptomyces sp. NPDC006530 TaxID=3364750 RepID=UPI0036881F96